MSGDTVVNDKKRKLQDNADIEINVSAPEPPSKKAQRKAKKAAEKTSSEGPVETKTSKSKDSHQAAPEERRTEHGVWIGNLAFHVNKDELRRFFTNNCSFTDVAITRVHLPKVPVKSGKTQNKGFAYVDFSNDKAAKEALGLSEQLLSGRRVLIKDAKDYGGRPEKPETDEHTPNHSGHPPSKRIFIGNLGFDVTKEILEEHLGKCGSIKDTHIATFQDSGKCKGYAWMQFVDIAAAEAAVRGYVMVDEEDEDDYEESGYDSSDRNANDSKPRQKKIWVNQLMGRRMRMEFAEDPTTRYNKRFGKEGKGRKNDATGDDDYTASFDGQSKGQNRARSSKTAQDDSRYDKETVQKMSGSIVEPRGKKTTFD